MTPLLNLRVGAMVLAILLAIVAWWRIPPPRARIYQLMGLIVHLALGVELIGYLTIVLRINNSLIYNVCFPIEFILMLAVMDAYRPAWRPAFVVGGAVGLGGLVWNGWAEDPCEFMLTVGMLVCALVLTLFLLALLWHLARTSEQALHHVPEFRLFMGLLVYFGGMVPVIGMIRYVYDTDQALSAQLWSILPVLCVVRYLLTALAFRSAVTTGAQRSHG